MHACMQSRKTSDVTVVVRVRPTSVSERHSKQQLRAVMTRRETVALQSEPNKSRDRDYDRIRNQAGSAGNKVVVDCDEDEVFHNTLHPPREFTFDAVMSEACSTDKVFQWTGARAVAEVVRGVSAVVFAYGQTGSGKTYTLLGEAAPSTAHARQSDAGARSHVGSGLEVVGIASMTVQLLLRKIAERAAKENGAETDIVTYTVEVSAVQVYLNQVYDLLSGDNKVLHVRSHTRQKTHTYIGGDACELQPKETYEECKSVEAFDALLQRVVSQRVQGSTHMNTRSSRSHLILTLAVKRTVQIRAANVNSEVCMDASDQAARKGRHHMSKLILVDLAGNERDSAREGAVQEAVLRAEGIDVNASLSALSACLRERVRNSPLERRREDRESSGNQRGSKAHDAGSAQSQQPKEATLNDRGKPGAGLYRHSTLTRLLREPLSCAKIFFLACCSPVASSAVMTGQTLTYAAMVKRIKTSAEDSAILLEHCMDRFPIEFLPHSALIQRGQIPRSSDENLTIYLHELRVSVVRVMVSHRWLKPNSDASLAHPDDEHSHKHKLLCTLFQRLGAEGWIRNYDVIDVVTWLDFGNVICDGSLCFTVCKKDFPPLFW
jgi:hypothetical protein